MCAFIGAPPRRGEGHFVCSKLRQRFGLLSTARGRLGLLAAVLPVAAAAGCATHPIADDVSPIPTEEIVRSARCEMRLGVLDEVQKRLREDAGISVDVRTLQTQEGRASVASKAPSAVESFLESYGKVGVAYDFEFNITEHNHAEAGIGFKLPYTSPAALDVGASASLNKIRTGNRTFSSQETFGEMIKRQDWCKDFKVRDKNLIYPITGSIGLRSVVKTFVAIGDQGGGKESFVDTLSFTTTITASITPTVKLNAVSNSFRLVSATGNLSADRTDFHKVKISLAFPTRERPKKEEKPKPAPSFPDDPNGPEIAPYAYNPVWRARYNICVSDARDREDAYKTLRHSPPEVYCIKYADAFVPTGIFRETYRYGYRRDDVDRYYSDDPSTESRKKRLNRAPQRQPRVWWW